MNLANKITIFRIFLIPVFLIVLLTNMFSPENTRLIATLIFILAAGTDALDGYIARNRNLITNFGKFMDPLADKLLVAAALISMVQLGDLHCVVVIIILSREFIITGFRTLAADNNVVIAASIWGKVKTVIQMVMIIFILPGFNKINKVTNIIGIILILLALFFTIISAVDYIYKNKNVFNDIK